MNKTILKWQNASNELARDFVDTYYEGVSDAERVDVWWAGGRIGEVLIVNDEFWSMQDIVIALELNVGEDDLFDWYYKTTEEGLTMNLEHYLRSKLSK